MHFQFAMIAVYSTKAMAWKREHYRNYADGVQPSKVCLCIFMEAMVPLLV